MRRRIPSFWTPEKDAELAAMWQAGLSAAVIARRFGNSLTRNAIIGRIHRVPGMSALRGKMKPPSPSHSSSWTPEFDDQLRAMVDEGKPTDQIANELGRSVGAIRWRLSRLKIKREAPSMPVMRAPEPIEPVEALPFVPPESSAPQPVSEPPTGLISIMELTEHTCRWPFGDPRETDFSYCGAWKSAAGPYCSNHAKRAKSTAAELRELREQAMGV